MSCVSPGDQSGIFIRTWWEQDEMFCWSNWSSVHPRLDTGMQSGPFVSCTSLISPELVSPELSPGGEEQLLLISHTGSYRQRYRGLYLQYQASEKTNINVKLDLIKRINHRPSSLYTLYPTYLTDWFTRTRKYSKPNIKNQSEILKSHKNKNWKKSIWLLGLFYLCLA